MLCETLRYPGGCASTFSKGQYQFEAGATLFSGLGPGQLFSRWNDAWDLGLRFDLPESLVELVTSTWSLEVPSDPEGLLRRFCALPHADPEALRAFFDTQRRTALALWDLFDDPALLPPLDGVAVVRHLARLFSYAPAIRWIGKPLLDVAEHYRLADWEPLRVYLDAVSQITVQTDASKAEAPFAMAAIDYFFHGTGHVHGGIGQLGWGLVEAIRRGGGRVMLPNRVRRIERRGSHWAIHARQGTWEAPVVIANLLPQTLRTMTDASLTGLDDTEAAVESGWGAAMLYLGVRSHAVSRAEAHHLQLIDDQRAPLIEGNHVFCSVSAEEERGRAPAGQRTVTVSTHVPMAKLRSLSTEDQAEYIAAVQASMRRTLESRAPALVDAIAFEMTASPRTFARFTGRHSGLVGGIPRRAGLHHYHPRNLWPRQAAPGLYLVGDSVLLGQSTLAVALGGVRTAEAIADGSRWRLARSNTTNDRAYATAVRT